MEVPPEICEKPSTLRHPATKQTRITQYLKKVKSRRIKKQNTWRPSKCQGGRMSTEMKEVMTPIIQTPSVNVKEATTGPQVHNVMKIQNGKDFQNFGKITHAIEMTKMKTLLKLGESVCKVCVNGRVCGIGFLLFQRFILTNAHVVLHILNDNMQQLSQLFTVTFDELPDRKIPVEVTAYRYGHDSSYRPLNYALLQLVGSEENVPPNLLPPALLSKCSHSPQEGKIFIIGHAEGDEKKMCITFITEFEKRPMAFCRYFSENRGHLAEIMESLWKEKWDFELMDNPHVMTYDASFLHGTSGSPVFQDSCQLVSLHTGGYSYTKDGKSYSIMEHAFPIMAIVQDILYKLLHNKVMQNQHKLDYLAGFSREALRGTQDMICMMAEFITEVVLKLGEDQLYPSALQVLLNATKGTTQRVKTQLRKALGVAINTKPSFKDISQEGMLTMANTGEENSGMKTLCRFLFEEERRALKDIHLNVLGEDKQQMKNRGKAKGRPGREGNMQSKALMRF
ncbi:serine protease FAM111A-like isoform X2 [Conger conger]|uniref:serine protease FAM111A-like isoform X2 n=1 Tax=Conger conger TaxID=82655 RepID=UPI002A5AFFC1|nr:serine protease FAM111A-like isoform X2 [Conger conger]